MSHQDPIGAVDAPKTTASRASSTARIAPATVSSVFLRPVDAATLHILERQNKLDPRAVVDFLAGLACAALERLGAPPPDDGPPYPVREDETASVPITAGVRQRLERCSARVGLSPGRILSMGLAGLRRDLLRIHLGGRSPFVVARNLARDAGTREVA